MKTLHVEKNYLKEQLWNRDAAISRLGGNESLLNRIVDMFLLQIEQKQNELNDAAIKRDAEAVRFNSHAMKGVCGEVGADAIKEQASLIEEQAKNGDLSNIDDNTKLLGAIINQTIMVMRAQHSASNKL